MEEASKAIVINNFNFTHALHHNNYHSCNNKINFTKKAKVQYNKIMKEKKQDCIGMTFKNRNKFTAKYIIQK